MKRVKKIAVAVLCLILALSFAGCQAGKEDFNVTGYIDALLTSSYSGDSTEYMGLTSQSASEAAENNTTTVNNAVVRFETKYNLFLTEEQKTQLTTVFTKAYANSQYTVQDKTEASYGYDVVISYSPQTTFSDLETQIRSLMDSSTSVSDSSDSYIDKIISLCSNMVDNPSYGDKGSITIDIQKSDSGELSFNLNLFDQLDELILPV